MICKGSQVHIPSAVNHLQQSSGDRSKNKPTIGGSHLVLPFERAPDNSVWIKENDGVGTPGSEVFHSKCKAHTLSEVNPRSAKVGLKVLVRPWVCTFHSLANVTREEEMTVPQGLLMDNATYGIFVWRNSKAEFNALPGLPLTVETEQIETY